MSHSLAPSPLNDTMTGEIVCGWLDAPLIRTTLLSSFPFFLPSSSLLHPFPPLCLPLHFFFLSFQVQLPGYLKSLPIPKSVGGFYELTRTEWLQLTPFFIFLITFVYIILSPFIGFLTNARKPRPRINSKQKLSEPKVADTVDIEDLGDKTVYCRCWRSNKVQCENNCESHNHEQAN